MAGRLTFTSMLLTAVILWISLLCAKSHAATTTNITDLDMYERSTYSTICPIYDEKLCRNATLTKPVNQSAIDFHCDVRYQYCTKPEGDHQVPYCQAFVKPGPDGFAYQPKDERYKSLKFSSCVSTDPDQLEELQPLKYKCMSAKQCIPHKYYTTVLLGDMMCCCSGGRCLYDFTNITKSWVNPYKIELDRLAALSSSSTTETLSSAADEKGLNSDDAESLAIKISLSVCAGVAFLSGCAFLFYKLHRQKTVLINSPETSDGIDSMSTESERDDISEHELSKDPENLAHLDQGSFGKIYTGRLNDASGEANVYKVIDGERRDLWLKERAAYLLPGMKHENIIKFLGAFTYNTGKRKKYIISLELHKNGSLQGYLKSHTLPWKDVVRICHGVMSGLAHLHEEGVVNGDVLKYPVAHRDIKSRNVLLKGDLTPCITDLGLAVQLPTCGVEPLSLDHAAGTSRYMAPELLDLAISFNRDAFLRIDVYAASLVLWEIMSRCDSIQNSEYHPPYEKEIREAKLDFAKPELPSLSVLQEVIIKRGKRPAFHKALYSISDGVTLIESIKESWDLDPESRLTARCLECRIAELMTPD